MNERQGKWILAGLVLFSLAWFLAPMMTQWMNGYGRVDRPTYEIATALYAACNARSDDRLSRVSVVIQEARQSEQVSARQVRWLERIVRRARDGDWEAAASSARRMMADQVTY